MRRSDKRIQNVFLVVSIVLIYIALILLLIHRPEEKEETLAPASLLTENDLMQDAAKHPELADSEEWIEPVLTEAGLEKEYSSGQTVSDTVCEITYGAPSPLSCELINGGVLTVGVNTSDSSAIWLNPEYTNENDSASSQYGIYVSSSDGNICYSSTERLSEGQTAGRCFVITDRTYDTLIPSDAGTYWQKSTKLQTNAEASVSVTVNFRVVRFGDYTVVGTAKATISSEGERYTIHDLIDTDVLASGEMSYEERSDLIKSAVEYILDSSRGPSFSSINEEYLNVMLNMATVEHCVKPYFSRLADSNGSCITAGSVSNCDLYAVNIPYIGTGNITIYAAPRLQVEGFNISSTFFNEDKDLQPFAYDFLYPFSKDTLLVPIGSF